MQKDTLGFAKALLAECSSDRPTAVASTAGLAMLSRAPRSVELKVGTSVMAVQRLAQLRTKTSGLAATMLSADLSAGMYAGIT